MGRGPSGVAGLPAMVTPIHGKKSHMLATLTKDKIWFYPHGMVGNV